MIVLVQQRKCYRLSISQQCIKQTFLWSLCGQNETSAEWQNNNVEYAGWALPAAKYWLVGLDHCEGGTLQVLPSTFSYSFINKVGEKHGHAYLSYTLPNVKGNK